MGLVAELAKKLANSYGSTFKKHGGSAKLLE